MLKLLFPIFSLFYNKNKWEKIERVKCSPYSAKELFVAEILGWMIVSLTILIVVSIPLVISYYEMKAFNRLCNSNASYIEALFAELRVTGDCMKDDN